MVDGGGGGGDGVVAESDRSRGRDENNVGKSRWTRAGGRSRASAGVVVNKSCFSPRSAVADLLGTDADKASPRVTLA